MLTHSVWIVEGNPEQLIDVRPFNWKIMQLAPHETPLFPLHCADTVVLVLVGGIVVLTVDVDDVEVLDMLVLDVNVVWDVFTFVVVEVGSVDEVGDVATDIVVDDEGDDGGGWDVTVVDVTVDVTVDVAVDVTVDVAVDVTVDVAVDVAAVVDKVQFLLLDDNEENPAWQLQL